MSGCSRGCRERARELEIERESVWLLERELEIERERVSGCSREN